jgi:extracellular factor (EF) 3-hydroxypalmitic acid methyl ester biosynthesis protein
MLIVSAKLLDSWIGLSSLIRENNVAQLREEVTRFVDNWESANQLNGKFILTVSQLRSFLGELSRWLGHIDHDYGREDYNSASHLSIEAVENIGDRLIPRMNELFFAFENEASRVPEDLADQHKAFAQRDLHPLLLSSPFVHRTLAKPLGYAGDYEMINMIQRDPIDGPTVYSRLLNKLFLNAPIPQSVRNRTDLMLSYLRAEYGRVKERGSQFSALSVGCGPAIEVQRFVSEIKERAHCEFSLLDFNEQTLGYAQKAINSCKTDLSKPVKVNYIWRSVHDLLKQPAREEREEKSYDLVYCSGLFDYLSDRVCARLTSLFYSWVRPGGVVVVTNMHKSNPNKFIMDYLMEWHLIYRDESVMQALCPTLGLQRVFCDATGINVVLEIRRAQSPNT